jgi:hypothetical protein
MWSLTLSFAELGPGEPAGADGDAALGTPAGSSSTGCTGTATGTTPATLSGAGCATMQSGRATAEPSYLARYTYDGSFRKFINPNGPWYSSDQPLMAPWHLSAPAFGGGPAG